LAGNSPPARAQTEPYRDLPPPRRSAREQQAGNIRARNGENQAHHYHENSQWLGILAAQRVDARAAFLQEQFRQELARFGISRGGFGELMKGGLKRGLRGGDAGARAQTAHDTQPIKTVVGESLGLGLSV
jgi:hypothetical protein